MPPLLVRLNLPGFSSPEPFRLASAPPSMTGLACAVLEEIGGFSKEELEGVRSNLDRVPLTLLGELCAGQLVELASDAELEVFLATSESPRGPAIIEVRPRGADISSSLEDPGSTSPASKPSVPPAAPPTVTLPPRAAANGALQQQQQQQQLQQRQQLQQEQQQQRQQLQLQQQQAMVEAGSSVSTGASYDSRRGPNQAQAANLTSGGAGHDSGRFGRHRAVTAPASAAYEEEEEEEASQAYGNGNGYGFEHTELPRQQQQAVWEAQPQPHTLQQSASEPSLTTAARPRTPNRSSQSRSDANRSMPRGGGGARASTPPSERRLPWEGDGGVRSRNARAESSGRNERAPVHVRLYAEKDDRRRRLEDARLRKIEQEEEDIRNAAQVALGRAPSPDRVLGGRAASPSSRSSPAPAVRTGTRTPPRMRPPLPERPANSAWSNCAPRSINQKARDRPFSAEAEGSSSAAPSPGMTPSPGPSALHAQDDPSMASENPHGASVGSFIGQDSMCGDAVGSTSVVANGDDVQSLKQVVTQQQQRIEFLENMHQQALRHVRKSREELARSQQQRFHEADRVLRLEQLVSEMQAQRFDGDVSAQLRWEEWLGRSRAIFEDEQE